MIRRVLVGMPLAEGVEGCSARAKTGCLLPALCARAAAWEREKMRRAIGKAVGRDHALRARTELERELTDPLLGQA